ncbi:hypothetical protein GCM10017562_65150 [Streptomyces roseofulvus]|uniref:non-ribosomal peptide synthetase n=1 Tax=Streptomyces roseofulvus TaxID=33902 RepID=UPI0031FBC0F9
MYLTQPPQTLLALFRLSVERYADKPAVSDGSRTLDYRQLDAASSALAARLVSYGIGREDRVGLYMDRSVDVFVALLAVLKAGAAYVAVDSRYPDARRDLMLRDSGARLVIVQPEWVSRTAGLGLQILPFAVPEPDAVEAAEPGVVVDPTSAASVLFTSGSSGTPKAIVLEHGNIVAFACNPALPSLRAGERVGQISSLSFDLFHFETWNSFASGCEVVVLPAVPDLLAAGFGSEMERLRIDAMLVPTMVVNHVVREDARAFDALRLLLFAGDVILPAACDALLSGSFSGHLYNLYGPAEATTACTAHLVTARDAKSDSVPIGRALHGVDAYVLDADGVHVADGTAGELYLGGAQVARGYLGRDDLTSERFVTHPGVAGGKRLYRTGDLVRRDGDGVLHFLGRADNQVKVRGYRVEPDEVERVLRRHPQVDDAVVLAVGGPGDRHLVAFAARGGAPDPAGDGALSVALRTFAESELPEFMVPSDFRILSEIPANHHGKRDTAALRALVEHRTDSGPAAAAAKAGPTPGATATETERYLIALWEEMLDTSGVTPADDFFGLGGHSLLAFRMQSRIDRELSVTLERGAVQRHTVLSDLAALVDEARDEDILI